MDKWSRMAQIDRKVGAMFRDRSSPEEPRFAPSKSPRTIGVCAAVAPLGRQSLPVSRLAFFVQRLPVQRGVIMREIETPATKNLPPVPVSNAMVHAGAAA